MTHRKLPKRLIAYRIGDPLGEWPVFSGAGSRKYPGRWNDHGQDMIYLAEHIATAMLEKIIRLHTLPPNQHYVKIDIPAGCSYEVANVDNLPGWHAANPGVARAFGARWFDECRSLILLVPSAITRIEQNILMNPKHRDFAKIDVGRECPVYWDTRLFEG